MCSSCSTCFVRLASISFVPCLSSWCLCKKYFGKHTYLSSWCLRYGLMIWSSLLLFKCMGNLFENLENPLRSSSLICQSLTKDIWWYFLKTIYTYAACFCIELCQIVVTLERNFVMLSWSRFMCTPHIPLLCFDEKLALYHPSISQNKCSINRVGLSLSSYC